jgi:CRISPR-associated endoribonuclease Cas6
MQALTWDATASSLHTRVVPLFEDAQTHLPTQPGDANPTLYRLSLLEGSVIRPSLRITTLSERGSLSIPFFLDTLTTEANIRIGTRRYRVSEALLSHSPWAGLSSWADFLAPPYGQTVRLHLGSPLVLPKEADTASGYHFPVPCQIFAELARRWQELGGPPLPIKTSDLFPWLLDGSIVLANYRLHGCQVLLDGHLQLGFRGWISYQCRSSVEAARVLLTALSRFAFFAGVETGTERGMGTTRVTIR